MNDFVFVTGGAGFVGRHLIPYLRQHGLKIMALARSRAAAKVLRELGAYAMPGNLYHYSMLRDTMTACHTVIHAASHSALWGEPKLFYQVNVEGSKSMLDAAKAAGVKKFIYISSAFIIGGAAVRHADETYIPDKPPKDMFSETKLMAEKAVFDANSPDFQTVSLRPPFVWGSDDPRIDTLKEYVEKDYFRWIAGGYHHLSTCHAQNLAAAIVAAINQSANGEFYYITDGEERTFREFSRAYADAYGLQLGNRSVPRAVALSTACFLQWVYKTLKKAGTPLLTPALIRTLGTEFTLDDSKARQQLGYTNAVSIDEGLKQLRQRYASMFDLN